MVNKNSLKTIVIVILSIIILVLISNDLSDLALNSLIKVGKTEVMRTTSPDSLVDCVNVCYDGGATTAFAYHLFLVPKGQKVPEDQKLLNGQEILIADHIEGLNVIWRSPKLLEIQYQKARVFAYRNFWMSKDIDNYHHIIDIKLNWIKG